MKPSGRIRRTGNNAYAVDYHITDHLGSLRLCYILHYLEGQDYEEIARSQGLAVSTVRSQCSRAKKAVSKYLL